MFRTKKEWTGNEGRGMEGEMGREGWKGNEERRMEGK